MQQGNQDNEQSLNYSLSVKRTVVGLWEMGGEAITQLQSVLPCQNTRLVM